MKFEYNVEYGGVWFEACHMARSSSRTDNGATKGLKKINENAKWLILTKKN